MDERIDIEVVDKVAKTIKPELLGISAAAKNAYTQIAKLKKELGVTSGSAVARAAREVATAEGQATRASAARERQARATAAALDKEAASASRLAAVAARAARTGVPQGSGANLGGFAGSKSALAAQNDVMRQGFDRVATSAKKAGEEVATAGAKIAATGKQASIARHHMLNLGFQLQDIFVSLASGQKPLTVFVQQGGQIGQIAAQAGVGIGGMAKAVGSLLLRFLPLAAPIAAAAGAFALFNHQINKDNDMKKFVKTLGLTNKEIKKLDDVSVTFGDTAKAVFEVGFARIASALGINTKKISSLWNSMLNGMWKGTKAVFAGIYAALGAAFDMITKRAVTDPIGDLKRRYADAEKFLDDVAKEAGNNARERLSKQAAGIIADRGTGGKSTAQSLAERQAEAIAKLNAELAREQATLARHLVGIDATVAERMDSIADSLAGVEIDLASDKWAKFREETLKTVTAIENEKRVVAALQSQFEQVVGPELDYAANVQALNELIAKGGDYTEEYRAQLNLLKQAYVEANHPLDAFNRELSEQQGLLFKMGNARSIQEYTNQIANAYRAKGKSAFVGGEAANDNGDIVARGQRTLLPEVQAQVDAFAEYLREQKLSDIVNDVFSSNGANDATQFLLENYDELYARIDEMRTGDLDKERQAAAAKAELNKRYLDARLANTENILHNLTVLEQSNVKEVAAIGKAAAIAEATIQGIKAVQGALSTPPYWPLNAPMVIATGVAAAANVAKIAGIGFQKGGYTGDVPPHQAVGAVHGREYVMDAAATARIGVPTLEALRNGRLNPGPAANNNGAKVTVINNAGADVEVRERSDGELEIIVDRALARKMGPMFERRLTDPNSRESRAIGSNYKTRRNR